VTYRCLIHKPTSAYAGQIVGEISKWAGLAKEPEAWTIVEVDLEPMPDDYEVELCPGVTVFASAIDGALIGGA
jgi:hypothetical protein